MLDQMSARFDPLVDIIKSEIKQLTGAVYRWHHLSQFISTSLPLSTMSHNPSTSVAKATLTPELLAKLVSVFVLSLHYCCFIP